MKAYTTTRSIVSGVLTRSTISVVHEPSYKFWIDEESAGWMKKDKEADNRQKDSRDRIVFQ